eukprot:403364901
MDIVMIFPKNIIMPKDFDYKRHLLRTLDDDHIDQITDIKKYNIKFDRSASLHEIIEMHSNPSYQIFRLQFNNVHFESNEVYKDYFTEHFPKLQECLKQIMKYLQQQK